MSRRWVIAVELLVIVALGAAAVVFWQHGVQPARTPVRVPSGDPVEVTVYDGAWLTTSTVMMTVAGVTAVDLVRRVILRLRGPQPANRT